jgi:hypothetical protein
MHTIFGAERDCTSSTVTKWRRRDSNATNHALEQSDNQPVFVYFQYLTHIPRNIDGGDIEQIRGRHKRPLRRRARQVSFVVYEITLLPPAEAHRVCPPPIEEEKSACK